jgi:sterol desaturase/sphingolipid hydroxylase (fatty acid hydroxylase superfamily)
VLCAGLALVLSPDVQAHPEVVWPSIAEGIQEFAVYGIAFFALFTCLLAWLLPKRRLSRRRFPRWRDVGRETIFSLGSQFVFLGVAAWTNWVPPQLISNMYTSLDIFGVPYYALTLFLAFFMHDTAFYWAHRMMHHPWLFERFHRVHHESVDPTPFATSAFHPLEAVVESLAALAPLIVFTLMPWHASVPIVWGIGQILFNVIGHAGFEIYPSQWLKLPILRWKTPALHHYMHHQRVGGNYGLYFRFWDKLCNTEFKDFEERYARLFDSHSDRVSTVPSGNLPGGA